MSATVQSLVPEVVKCNPCKLPQYRTKTNLCRRCLAHLPSRITTAELLKRFSSQIIFPYPRQPSLPPVPQKELSNRKIIRGIGKRIRIIRMSQGLSTTVLRTRAQLNRSLVSKIEHGKGLSLETLERFARAFNTSLARLFAPLDKREILLEDPFIREIAPLLPAQRNLILRALHQAKRKKRKRK